MTKLKQLTFGAGLIVLSSTIALPAMAASISGNQLTVSSTIPNGSSRFPLSQINDGIKSDASPFNGFQGRNRTTGTLTFGLDQTYRLTGFKLWNDINVREEGVKKFRLEFLNASGGTIRSQTFTAQAGINGAQNFNFTAVPGVKTVKMHVDSFLPGRGIVRTEIREVEFVGEPMRGGAGGRDLPALVKELTKECIPCFGRDVKYVYGGSGRNDNFSGSGSEKPSPRTGFNNITAITGYNSGRSGITRDYDEMHANEFFIETLQVQNASQIQKGWIAFSAKDRGGLVTTDSIYMGDVLGHFQESQLATQQNRPRNDIHARVFAKKYTDFRTQVNAFADPVFKYDNASGLIWANLSDIELISKSHSGTTNMLEQIKTDGLTDFLIQDDTGVDFVAIITCVPNPKGKTFVDQPSRRGGVRFEDRVRPRDIKKLRDKVRSRGR